MDEADKIIYKMSLLIFILVLMYMVGTFARDSFKNQSNILDNQVVLSKDAKIWQNTSHRLLEVYERCYNSQARNLLSNCVMDCYRFQLDFGHNDIDYCEKMCRDKYRELDNSQKMKP